MHEETNDGYKMVLPTPTFLIYISVEVEPLMRQWLRSILLRAGEDESQGFLYIYIRKV